jgi:pimeloyl-ACP methyl ester carboxylesterase
MTYSEKIERLGYKFQELKVETKDGYLNTIWRIPGKKSEKDQKQKTPILLQHGLLDDSWTFFAFTEAEFCLPFILADLGYDVWLGNTRGNAFSWENMDPKKSSKSVFSEYWNFSLDEIAAFDFPANVEFVRNSTGYDKIIYIGHSQGTIQYFINYMIDPNFISNRISKFVAIGPVPFIFNTVKIIKFLIKRFNLFHFILIYFSF